MKNLGACWKIVRCRLKYWCEERGFQTLFDDPTSTLFEAYRGQYISSEVPVRSSNSSSHRFATSESGRLRPPISVTFQNNDNLTFTPTLHNNWPGMSREPGFELLSFQSLHNYFCHCELNTVNLLHHLGYCDFNQVKQPLIC